MKKVEIVTDNDILFYAFRYALGGRTGAVDYVVNEILKHWDKLPANDKEMYKSEINTAINRDMAGDLCDVKSWQKILKIL